MAMVELGDDIGVIRVDQDKLEGSDIEEINNTLLFTLYVSVSDVITLFGEIKTKIKPCKLKDVCLLLLL